MTKKKVLFISAGIYPIPANMGGAVEELIDVFAENNRKHGRFDVSVASCRYGGKEIKRKVEGVKYRYFRTPLYVKVKDKIYHFYSEKILKDWKSLFRQNYYKGRHYIEQIVKKTDLREFDVIVVENNMSLLKTLSDALGDDYSKKCMYHMHSNLIDNEEMIPYLARARKILAVSDFVKNLLYDTVPQFKDTQIEKVGNGIKIEKLEPKNEREIRTAVRNEYSIKEDETVFLFCGRVSPEKGVLEMTKAYAAAIPELGRSKLMIVGSGLSGSNKETYYYKQIKKIAREHPNNVILTGYVNHGEVHKYHVAADALVVPSIMDDPAPLTVLEGMSRGMYLLLSNVGGIPEYTRSYENKIMFERDDDFEQNIRSAMLKFYGEYSAAGYERKPVYFDDAQYYENLAEAIDVD
ncbi:MAG: glycosyltransferase family 4 protein [Clostridiales bacterium]|nr:glycosyltransferase family 4 protein [Clostridiales bacterium]